MAHKTAEEWFDMLPYPYAIKAFNNATLGRLKVKRVSILSALSSSFVWEHTEEKYKFWSDLYDDIASGKIKLTNVKTPKETATKQPKTNATQAILKYLKSGKSLNQLKCLELFGTWRLSRVIYDLKQHGYTFEKTTKVVTTRYGIKTSITIYKLCK